MKSLSVILFFLCLGVAGGVVIITDIPDRSLFGILSDQEFEIDLDGDGTNDVRLEATSRSMRIVSLREAVRLSTVLTGGLNLGGNNIPFAVGDEIGGALPSGATWFDAIPQNGSSTLLSCVNIGCIGFWGGGINYSGVQITDSEGDQRYGWIEIDAPFETLPGGIVQRYAFETDANRSIMAIPELNSTMLILFGMGGAFLRRDRG